MLGDQLYSTIEKSFDSVIDMLGTKATWTSAKTGDTKSMVVGNSSLGNTDQNNVNAYALAGRTLTAKVKDFPIPPEKFDSFVVKGEKYIAEAVHPIRLNDSIIGWKIVTRGK